MSPSISVTETSDLPSFPDSNENGNTNNHDLTILLAEDNPDLRGYICALLSEKYRVIATENGQQAFDWLKTNKNPSLIISDIMMPVMDGLELLQHVKASEELRHIPMIMLTARQSMEAKLSALQLGVDDYITKPFSEPELLVRIDNILKHQKERLAFIEQENKDNPTEEKLTITLSASDQEWLNGLEKVVNENLADSQFSAETCADSMHISRRQLQRRVKKCTGLGVNQYIRLARLQSARHLLESGTVTTVAETSYQVGYDTPAYFTKLYHQEFGKKPSEVLQME